MHHIEIHKKYRDETNPTNVSEFDKGVNEPSVESILASSSFESRSIPQEDVQPPQNADDDSQIQFNFMAKYKQILFDKYYRIEESSEGQFDATCNACGIVLKTKNSKLNRFTRLIVHFKVCEKSNFHDLKYFVLSNLDDYLFFLSENASENL